MQHLPGMLRGFYMHRQVRCPVRVIDHSWKSESVPREQQQAPSAQAIAVLYIEADHQRVSRVCDDLRRVGFAAFGASNAATAIQLVLAHKPTVVLLGSVPCAEGLAFCRSLKQVLPNVVVLVHTPQPELWHLSVGFIAGVVPPCTRTQELVEEICAWLTHGNSGGAGRELRDALAFLRAAGDEAHGREQAQKPVAADELQRETHAEINGVGTRLP